MLVPPLWVYLVYLLLVYLPDGKLRDGESIDPKSRPSAGASSGFLYFRVWYLQGYLKEEDCGYLLPNFLFNLIWMARITYTWERSVVWNKKI